MDVSSLDAKSWSRTFRAFTTIDPCCVFCRIQTKILPIKFKEYFTFLFWFLGNRKIFPEVSSNLKCPDIDNRRSVQSVCKINGGSFTHMLVMVGSKNQLVPSYFRIFRFPNYVVINASRINIECNLENLSHKRKSHTNYTSHPN